MVYLDNAATTFPKADAVYIAMDNANRHLAFNAGRGAYDEARVATAIIDDLRDTVSTLLRANNIASVIFTPSVTIAMHQIINGLSLHEDDTVYVSPYEHNAVARNLNAAAETKGFSVKLFPLDSALMVDVEKLRFMFSVEPPTAVIMTAVSNVTGYVLPITEICDVAKEYGAITIIDGAQAVGLLPLDMSAIEADIIAGHKTMGGPFGIGGFALRNGIALNPVLFGGTGSDSLSLDMPKDAPGRYEAASPNIVAMAGLLASLKELDVDRHIKKVLNLTDILIKELSNMDKVHLMGICPNRNTLGIVSFVVDGYASDEVGTILNDEFHIAVRTGYHCAPFIHDFLGDKPYSGTVRASVGMFNTEEDINEFVKALLTL